MAADNTITVCGSATREPELRYTSGGRAVCSFGVAQNDRYKNDAGEWVDGNVSFFNVTAWADLAEHLAESVGKGTRVIVTGKMQQRSYETNDGEKRTVWDLIASDAGPSLKWATASIAKTQRTGPRDDAPNYEDQDQSREPF
jgi:single-strand DNA-binding protein